MPRPSATAAPTDGAVLVRVPARDRGWAAALPSVPDGRTLTVTVGHPDLLPVPVDDLVGGGYRIVGVASAHRPVGPSVDIFVPRQMRTRYPGWWADLLGGAERVFDLHHGPVLRVLATQIGLHVRSLQG